MSPAAESRPAFEVNGGGLDLLSPQTTIGRRLVASLPVERTPGNNDPMVVLALILLVLVAVLVVAIVVSNPQTYDLSIFGAVIPATSAGIFITGAVTMAVTILALLLLRTGMRRARARRTKLKELEASDQPSATSSSSAPDAFRTTKETRTESTDARTESKTAATSATSDATAPEASKDASRADVEHQSSTTAAERQAMLDEADRLTRDEPQA